MQKNASFMFQLTNPIYKSSAKKKPSLCDPIDLYENRDDLEYMQIFYIFKCRTPFSHER